MMRLTKFAKNQWRKRIKRNWILSNKGRNKIKEIIKPLINRER